MNAIRALAETLHRAMHRLPGMPDHSEAAARQARAAAQASAWSTRTNRPRRHQLRSHS